ncbi:MAG: hypothetical protein V4491_01870 [Pseudomonadota bacterium]
MADLVAECVDVLAVFADRCPMLLMRTGALPELRGERGNLSLGRGVSGGRLFEALKQAPFDVIAGNASLACQSARLGPEGADIRRRQRQLRAQRGSVGRYGDVEIVGRGNSPRCAPSAIKARLGLAAESSDRREPAALFLLRRAPYGGPK